jgi:5-formyltetrahydrofolate cyclo-ligase
VRTLPLPVSLNILPGTLQALSRRFQMQEAGLISPHTLIVTTVHSLQVVKEVLPESEHDFRVDLIVTQDETIEYPAHPRPPGIIWEHLATDSIAAIPALENRKPSER